MALKLHLGITQEKMEERFEVPSAFDRAKFEADHIRHLSAMSIAAVVFIGTYAKDRAEFAASWLPASAIGAFIASIVLCSIGFATRGKLGEVGDVRSGAVFGELSAEHACEVVVPRLSDFRLSNSFRDASAQA